MTRTQSSLSVGPLRRDSLGVASSGSRYLTSTSMQSLPVVSKAPRHRYRCNTPCFRFKIDISNVRVPAWMLLVPICVIFMIALGITVYAVTYKQSESVLDYVTGSYRQLACITVENEIAHLLDSFSTAVSHLAQYVESSDIDSSNQTPLDVRKEMYISLSGMKWASSIYVGSENGECVVLNQSPNPGSSDPSVWAVADQRTVGNDSRGLFHIAIFHINGWKDPEWQDSFNRATLLRSVGNSTMRVWWTKAVAGAPSVAYPPAYASYTPRGMEITQPVAQAIVRSGRVANVAVIDIALRYLDEFLQNIVKNLFAESVAFIVELDTGILLASSIEGNHSAYKSYNTSTGEVFPLEATAVSDPTMRELAQSLADPVLGWQRYLDYSLEGVGASNGYFLNVRRIRVEGIKWVLVVGTKKDAWMSQISSRLPMTLGLVVLSVACISGLLVITLRLAMSPFHRLMVEMARLSHSDFDRMQPMATSYIAEIAVFARAFNDLVFRLKELRTFLPQQLFQTGFPDSKSEGGPLMNDPEEESNDGESCVPASSSGARVLDNSTIGQPNPAAEHPGSSALRPDSGSSSRPRSPTEDVASLSSKKVFRCHVLSARRSSLLVFPQTDGMLPPSSSSGSRKLLMNSHSVPPKLMSGANLRSAVVACIDMVNFSLAAQRGFSQLRALHHHYVSLVHDVIQAHSGTLDRVLGDRLFANWNVPQRCPRAELKAVQCTMSIPRQLQTLRRSLGGHPTDDGDPRNVVSTVFGTEGIRVRIGLASSLVHFGVLGSDTIRLFAVVGDAVGQAVVLQRLVCRLLQVEALVTEEIAKQVECLVKCVPAMVLRLPGARVLPCYQPVSEHHVPEAGDEWMYAIQSNDAAFQTSREVFAQYCQHIRDNCRQMPLNWPIRTPALSPPPGGGSTHSPTTAGSAAPFSGQDSPVGQMGAHSPTSPPSPDRIWSTLDTLGVDAEGLTPEGRLRKVIQHFPNGFDVPFMF